MSCTSVVEVGDDMRELAKEEVDLKLQRSL